MLMVANRVVLSEAMVQPSVTFHRLLDRFTEELREQHHHDLKDVMVAAQAEKKVLIEELRELRQLRAWCSCSCSAGQKSPPSHQDEELPHGPLRQLQSVPVHSAMDEVEEEGSEQSNDAGVAEDLDIVEDVEDWDEDVPDVLPTRTFSGGSSGSFSGVPQPPPKPAGVAAPQDDDPRLFVDANRNLLNESGSTTVENGTDNEVIPVGPQETEKSDNEKSDKSEGGESETKKDDKDDFIAQLQASLRNSPAASGVGTLADARKNGAALKAQNQVAAPPALKPPSSPSGSKRPSWGGEDTKKFDPDEPVEEAKVEPSPQISPEHARRQSLLKKRSSTTSHLDCAAGHHHHKKDRKKSHCEDGLSQLPELPTGLKALDLSMDLAGAEPRQRRSLDKDHKRGSGGGLHSGRMSLDVTSLRHNELILHPALQLVAPEAAMQAAGRRVTWCGDDANGAGLYATQLHAPPPPAVAEEEEQEEEAIEMLPIWKMRRKSTANGMNSARHARGHRNSLQTAQNGLKRSSKAELDIEIEDMEAEWAQNICCEKLSRRVSKPSSAKRLMWDIFGVFLIGYDLFWIPMQAFDPEKTTFTTIMSWLTTCFWTIDIPCSFLVGFHREGILEMRITRIAKHYFATWFVFDIIVITVDWTLSLVDIVTENAVKNSSVGGVGYMRLAKAVRFLRLLRLLRLLKAHGVVSELIDRIQSESHLILIGIVRLLVFIMMVNHLIACVWFGIGSSGISEMNWPENAALDERGLAYKYLTSLHWSLTQFTPASMEVVPENELERAFTVIIILSAMIVFSSFVSAITNAMTQLRNLNSERNEQFSSLRRYLGENKCSTALMGRIWTCVQTAMGRTKRRVHESDVKVLQMLPWSLKAELLEEVYNPILGAHPFFNQFSILFAMQMRKIYQNAVEEISLPIGQELFSSGEAANNMYFVLTGVMVYTKDNKSSCEPPCFVSAGQWVSEAALWIKWKHNGQLIGTTPCELIALKVAKVQEVLSHLNYDEDQVKRYVKIFVRYFKKNPDALTDVWAETDLLNDMAQKAFMGEEDDDEAGGNQQMMGQTKTGGGFSGWAQRRQSVNPAGRMLGGAGSMSTTTMNDRSRRQSIFAGGLSGLFGRGGGGANPGLEADDDDESSSDSDSDSESDSEEEEEEENGAIEEGEEDEDEEEENEESEKKNKRPSKESDNTEEAMDGKNSVKSLGKNDSISQGGSRRPSAAGLPQASGRRPSAAGLGLGAAPSGRGMSLGMAGGARRQSMTSSDMAKLPLSVLEAMKSSEPPKEQPAPSGSRRPSVANAAGGGGGSRRPSTNMSAMPAPMPQEERKSSVEKVQDAVLQRVQQMQQVRGSQPTADEVKPLAASSAMRGSMQVAEEGIKPPATARGSGQQLEETRQLEETVAPAKPTNGPRGSLGRSIDAFDRKMAAAEAKEAAAEAAAEAASPTAASRGSMQADFAPVKSSGSDDSKGSKESIKKVTSNGSSRKREQKRKSLQSECSDVSMDDEEIDNFLERCKHKKRSSDMPIEEPDEPQSLPLKLLNVLRTSDGGENVRRNSKNAPLPFAARSSTGSNRGEPVSARLSSGSTRSRGSSGGMRDSNSRTSEHTPRSKGLMSSLFGGFGGSKGDTPSRRSEGDTLGQPAESDFSTKASTSGRFGGWFGARKTEGNNRESAKKSIFPSS